MYIIAYNPSERMKIKTVDILSHKCYHDTIKSYVLKNLDPFENFSADSRQLDERKFQRRKGPDKMGRENTGIFLVVLF